MLYSLLRQLLRNVFGGGADLSAANPLPVDLSPGNKTTATILDEATIGAAATTGLVNCDAIDLLSGPLFLTLTVKALYTAAAVAGMRVHVRTSPTNQASGTHTAVFGALIMTDALAHFIADELIGLTIVNVATGNSAVITDNDETTVTVAAIVGGWTTGDAYTISGADYDTIDWDTWNIAIAAGLPVRQTETYDASPAYIKVLIENLDAAEDLADVLVIATRGA